MGADGRNDVLRARKTVSRGREIFERRRGNICDQHRIAFHTMKGNPISRANEKHPFYMGVFL